MEAPARGRQELHLWPVTVWGKLAIASAGAFVPLVALFISLLVTGPQGGTTFNFTPRMIPGLLAAGCAAGALATGLIGVVFKQERSLFALVATAIGFFVTAFLVGEFAVPPYD